MELQASDGNLGDKQLTRKHHLCASQAHVVCAEKQYGGGLRCLRHSCYKGVGGGTLSVGADILADTSLFQPTIHISLPLALVKGMHRLTTHILSLDANISLQRTHTHTLQHLLVNSVCWPNQIDQDH